MMNKQLPFVLLLLFGWHSLTGDELRSNPTDTPDQAQTKLSAAEQRELNDAVSAAFAKTHGGWSADEVIINDELNKPFITECRAALPETDEWRFNWTLLNLRKAGKLSSKATKRRTDRHDEYVHAAEIAARLLQDKYETSMDRILCDPDQRAEFDKAAKSVAPEVDPYLLRKAALRLRKTRQLKPELVVRVADWKREIITLSADDILKKPESVPTQPGVYIFRDDTGYLYIGESSDLRSRVTKHLDHSDRKSLAHYLWDNGIKKLTVELHAFDPASKAKEKTARRAYESELIRSRKPRFNIAP